jgi:fucose permease
MIQIRHKSKKMSLSLFSILLSLTAFAISADSIPALVTTMAEEFAISYNAFGYIFMLQFISFTCASWSGGYMQQRFGFSHRMLVIVGIFSVSLLYIIGGALSSFLWVFIWVIPMGYAGGLIETFCSIMITEFEDGNSSKLMNLSQVFYCAGAALSPQLVAILLDAQISWRVIFLILGIYAFFIGGFFTLFHKNPIPSPQVPSNPESKSTPFPSHNLLKHDRLFYLMAAIVFLYIIIEFSSASWLAAYFEKIFHVSASSAARRLSLFWAGLIIGRAFMVVAPAKLTLWPGLLGGAFGMIIGNIFLSLCWSPRIAAWTVLFCGIAAGPVWPIAVMLSQHIRRSDRFTSGVIGSGALGAALGPLLSAQVIRHLGLAWLFPFLSISSIVLFSLILITKHRICGGT